MNRKGLLRSPPVNRRLPLLTEKAGETKKGRCGEVAGGTAADCAAVCCCCPCGLMNLLILTTYKAPTAIWKKVWLKKRKRMIKRNGLLQQQSNASTVDVSNVGSTVEIKEKDVDGTKEAADLEKEMWDRFYGTGFWRSTSQSEN